MVLPTISEEEGWCERVWLSTVVLEEEEVAVAVAVVAVQEFQTRLLLLLLLLLLRKQATLDARGRWRGAIGWGSG